MAHAEALAAELLERAHLIAQRLSGVEAEEEGLQFCNPSPPEGLQNCNPSESANNILTLQFKEVRGQNCNPTEGDQFCTPSTRATPAMWKAALFYVNQDELPVFPVRQDKTPFTLNGFKDATRDAATVARWWRNHPDAGIGVPTGSASGWLALDIDPRHGGDVALTELLEQYGPLPDTLAARTGGGGQHLIFAYPASAEVRNSAGKLGEGIDVRGEGGYIVVAPSLHASGRRYEWLNDHSPAPVPDWLLELLTTEKRRAQGVPAAKSHTEVKSGAVLPYSIADGQRGEAMFKVACSLRGKGASYEEIEAELLHLNAQRCVPPKDEREVQKIARSAMRYQPNAAAVGV